MIKEIIIGASSAVIAGFIGYKIGSKKSQKYVDKQIESTKKALKDYYENKLSEKDKTIEEQKEIIDEKTENMMIPDLGVDPGINEDPVNVFKDPREQFPGIIKAIPTKERVTLKDDVMKRPKDLPPTAIDTPDGYPDPNNTNVEPYLIRNVDYGSLDNFEMQELVLWEDNYVTTDDAAYDIVSPTYLFKLLPEGWINMFGWGTAETYKDELYFRNNKEKKDIQITKAHRTLRSWIEEVCPGRLDELGED